MSGTCKGALRCGLQTSPGLTRSLRTQGSGARAEGKQLHLHALTKVTTPVPQCPLSEQLEDPHLRVYHRTVFVTHQPVYTLGWKLPEAELFAHRVFLAGDPVGPVPGL